MKITILCLVNTLLMVTGQLLFKLGSRNKSIFSVGEVIKLLFSPVILIALVIYALTTILWLFILSKVDISFAYPIQALAFPIVLVLSSLLFNEIIPVNRWLGICIIIIGVIICVQK